jgi:hypothetical protein
VFPIDLCGTAAYTKSIAMSGYDNSFGMVEEWVFGAQTLLELEIEWPNVVWIISVYVFHDIQEILEGATNGSLSNLS